MGSEGSEGAQAAQLKAMSHPGSRMSSLTKTHRHQRAGSGLLGGRGGGLQTLLPAAALTRRSRLHSSTAAAINHPGRCDSASPGSSFFQEGRRPRAAFRNRRTAEQQVHPARPTEGRHQPHIWSSLLHTWVLDTLWKAYLDTHFQGRSRVKLRPPISEGQHRPRATACSAD